MEKGTPKEVAESRRQAKPDDPAVGHRSIMVDAGIQFLPLYHQCTFALNSLNAVQAAVTLRDNKTQLTCRVRCSPIPPHGTPVPTTHAVFGFSGLPTPHALRQVMPNEPRNEGTNEH
uniref:Uncharacterized protein n=1 Tax=Eutreptiella gymnastica TaxID=73025 RepID=A0A7S4CYU7_9EUGL